MYVYICRIFELKSLEKVTKLVAKVGVESPYGENRKWVEEGLEIEVGRI